MNASASNEREAWARVEQLLGDRRVTLGQHWSFNIYNDPKRLAFVLSRYKFAAKMAGNGRRVLELGCSEGLGGLLLAEFAAAYTGVDYDAEAIETAKRNWTDPKFSFHCDDFLDKTYGAFDSVVSLDVIEHIEPSCEALYFEAVSRNLQPEGRCVIGTPNVTSEAYASAPSKAGHVNLYDHQRLRAVMQKHFRNVFMFGLNDEIVHTGFAPMTHYLMAVGCGKRS
jgi:2-polyprenyl-3-methyl-5-hydroxy-6-metoxy-1,4-benzoquinol methylase